MTTFDEMAQEIYEHNRRQGFYRREVLGTIPAPQYHVPSADPFDGPREIVNPSFASEKLMLIVSECAEAQDALRNDDRENEAEEIADILIRTLDYAAWRGISLDIEVDRKMERNRARPVLHGRKGF